MSGDNKDLGQGAAELEAIKAENAKLKQDMEDMKMEVFSPDYLSFLENKDAAGKKVEEKPPVSTKDDLAKMTPEELIAKAKEMAKSEMAEEIKKARQETVKELTDAQAKKEIASFARSHPDFEKWRPLMYSLSCEKQYESLSLQELYDLARTKAGELHNMTETERAERAKKMHTEKPGYSSESLEKYRKMDADSIAKEAAAEVEAELGPLPPA